MRVKVKSVSRNNDALPEPLELPTSDYLETGQRGGWLAGWLVGWLAGFEEVFLHPQQVEYHLTCMTPGYCRFVTVQITLGIID